MARSDKQRILETAPDRLDATTQRGEHSSHLQEPEPLRHVLAGCWSRRIDEERRLVYLIDGDDLAVLQARYHYEP